MALVRTSSGDNVIKGMQVFEDSAEVHSVGIEPERSAPPHPTPFSTSPNLPPAGDSPTMTSVGVLHDPADVSSSSGSLSISSITALSKLHIRSKRWARLSVERFGQMTYREFREAVTVDPSLLSGSSMKHESWGDSGDPSGPSRPMYILTAITFLVAVVCGLALGIATGVVTGVVGASCVVAGVAIVFMAALIWYMVAYADGLHKNKMGKCVDWLGFLTNIRANIICRYIMTCCFNGKIYLVGLIMGGEAADAAKRIKAQGKPQPGGVCWLGDSEFTFWHNLKEDMKAFHENSFNAGFGGSRLVDIRRNIGPLCLDWEPSIVIVHAGGNDFDFDRNLTPAAVPARLMEVFEILVAHPSVKRVGYMLSSRRPVYSDLKWEFMLRVHELTIAAIKESPLVDIIKVLDLRDMVHPLDDFVPSDRVHLNQNGHYKKSLVLLPKILAVWPQELSDEVSIEIAAEMNAMDGTGVSSPVNSKPKQKTLGQRRPSVEMPLLNLSPATSPTGANELTPDMGSSPLDDGLMASTVAPRGSSNSDL